MPLKGSEVLLIEKSPEGIETITINRPERQNKFSFELVYRLAAAWEDFRTDDNAIVAIVTAAGDTFITGPDVVEQAKEEQAKTSDKKSPHFGFMPRFFPHEIWKPIICAINGDAAFGGFHLADACDLRIAADNAMFSIPEAKWNFPAPWIGEMRNSFSLAHAYEIALWGDGEFTAQRLYEMGWLNRVVPKEKVMEEAMSWARRVLDLSPRTVRNVKQLIWRAYTQSIPESQEYAHVLEQNLTTDENSLEGVRAFTENRQPKYKRLGRPPFWHGKEPLPGDLSWK